VPSTSPQNLRSSRPLASIAVCDHFALNLAYEWGKLERPAKITLAKGERQRDRVLTDAEWHQYIAECPQPWRDAAVVIRGTEMRPDEVFGRRWENIHLNDSGGLIPVTDGKTEGSQTTASDASQLSMQH